MEFRVERFDSVASTNEGILRALEAGEAEGLVWRARQQTGGYGRQGRSWASPVGGLYQSLLLRPDVPLAQLPTLGLVVALSVRATLLSLAGLRETDVLVKWPNDVLGAAGKLSGISLEAHAGGVCVGIGVNVQRPVEEVPVGGKNVPAYVEDLMAMPLSADQLGDELLAVFADRYDCWQREGLAPFLDEFRACDALAGKPVKMTMLDGSVLVEGVARGIDEWGRLLVATGDGGVQAVSSGEAHLVA